MRVSDDIQQRRMKKARKAFLKENGREPSLLELAATAPTVRVVDPNKLPVLSTRAPARSRPQAPAMSSTAAVDIARSGVRLFKKADGNQHENRLLASMRMFKALLVALEDQLAPDEVLVIMNFIIDHCELIDGRNGRIYSAVKRPTETGGFEPSKLASAQPSHRLSWGLSLIILVADIKRIVNKLDSTKGNEQASIREAIVDVEKHLKRNLDDVLPKSRGTKKAAASEVSDRDARLTRLVNRFIHPKGEKKDYATKIEAGDYGEFAQSTLRLERQRLRSMPPQTLKKAATYYAEAAAEQLSLAVDHNLLQPKSPPKASPSPRAKKPLVISAS